MFKFLVLFLWATAASALTLNGNSCVTLTVTAQLVATCSDGTIVSPPVDPITPVVPSGTPIVCTLTGTASSLGYSTFIDHLTASCTPAATSYTWSESGCVSSLNTCSAIRVPNKVYTVTGTSNGSSSTASFHF